VVLTHVKPIDSTCITRQRHARGFQYLDEQGAKITDKQELKRIKDLVIPPMWEEVEICIDEKEKVQATGRDKKGRKQYIYHEDWEKQQQAKKFERLVDFAKALPAFRQHCHELVERKGFQKEKILALMVLVLDDTGMRVGNDAYTKRNGTYGLSNLRRKHLDENDQDLLFHYKGKSGKQRKVVIDDPDLVQFIKSTAEQPGYEIFRYKEGGKWYDVHSDELNAFIQKGMGEEYSSKYFRTWVACKLAVERYPEAKQIVQEAKRKTLLPSLVKLVAKTLGNTPAVCRAYYIHPTLLKKIEVESLPEVSFKEKTEEEVDKLVLNLILK